MCAPTNITAEETPSTKRVVISGAGPAGLLMASLLLSRNKDSETPLYHVTLIDGREDYGFFTKEELCASHRSWMLGLADHGMDAIKTLPELYENYVKGEGILVKEFNLYLGSKKISQTIDTSKFKSTNVRKVGEPAEGFIVDRNFIVAALARYIRETHEDDENYTPLYGTKCQYVDYENKMLLMRDVSTKEETYMPYDLLIGSDGVRSTVREALVKRHSNFSCDVTDIFQEFKGVHIKIPEDVNINSMSVFPDVFPYCQGIGLPETGGMLNVSIGVSRNNFDQLPKELKSDDYRVVSKYVEENFKPFKLHDYDDFAKQWVGQRWNQTGMVHCNFYHSVQAGIVIMGDAAHATSPSIGMGMNTALRDAQIFHEILMEHKDDLSKALPAFSKERVKEGNSLSDLAMHLYCMDKGQQTKATFHMIIRNVLNKFFPSLVEEHAQVMIGRRGVSLCEVYQTAVRQGVMRKHRAMNDQIRMEYFEKTTGMIPDLPKKNKVLGRIVFGAVLVAVIAAFYQNTM